MKYLKNNKFELKDLMTPINLIHREHLNRR